MKAYEVAGCNLDGFRKWSGTVIDTEEKGVSEAVKKKFGLDYLYCEKFPNKRLQERGEDQFRYSEISIESVTLHNLTVGELLGMIRHNGEVRMDWELITRLMNCFPNSFINHNGEFIAHAESNTYFVLGDCKTELDVKCKVLEWVSRAAYKTEPYSRRDKNEEFHEVMRGGMIEFLGVYFSESDMETIYTHLGSACNHEKTIAFVMSGYDMKILESEDQV